MSILTRMPIPHSSTIFMAIVLDGKPFCRFNLNLNWMHSTSRVEFIILNPDGEDCFGSIDLFSQILMIPGGIGPITTTMIWRTAWSTRCRFQKRKDMHKYESLINKIDLDIRQFMQAQYLRGYYCCYLLPQIEFLHSQIFLIFTSVINYCF
jgi:hypothetical protein